MTNPLWLVRTRMATSRMRAEVDDAKAAAEARRAAPAAPAGEAAVAGGAGAGGAGAGGAGVMAKEARGRAASQEYATMASTIRAIARDEGVVRHAPCATTRQMPHGSPRLATSRPLPLRPRQAGFFKGLQASLLGLSHIMIQFPLYEALKRDLVRSVGGAGAVAGGGGAAAGGAGARGVGSGEARPSKQRVSTSGVWPIVAAAAISKLIASSFTYPHEVIRSRLQFDRSGEMCAPPRPGQGRDAPPASSGLG